MPRRASAKDLLHIAESRADKLSAYQAGISLTTRTGYSIDELRGIACRDRMSFAREILKSAQWALAHHPPLYRLALGRAYYSMYHSIRTVVFFMNGGDDHQEHRELPKHLPRDFPNSTNWENALKDARLERNHADYEAYPRNAAGFKSSAERTVQKARELLPIARRYLIQKGCDL